MKKTFLLIAVCIFSVNVFAGNGNPSETHPNKYCAKMQNGKLIVEHEGSTVTSEVALDNGTKIKPDGTIMKADGTKMMLKEGQCIDMDGKIMKKSSKQKMNKDRDQETY